MCDTLGSVAGGRSLFGKNSDRSPNEPQVLEYVPAMLHTEKELRATYISIPQQRDTHAVLLSRPTWMWGAEIGVNDCGVCIGNEAVFTLGRYGRTGLTGMDMLRLALERSEYAEQAVGVIIALLEKYGQGGNCGYDHDFYYDNSFLIMDRGSLFVLETCGKKWVYKRYDEASISNRLSIGKNGDRYSEGKPYDFAGTHTERVYTFGSGSASRREQTLSCVYGIKSVGDVFSALRTHEPKLASPFASGSVGSACMHFGGAVGDHTTQSMAVEQKNDRTVVWATGSSTPCVSLFKPWEFGKKLTAPFFAADDPEAKRYWYKQEHFRRGLIGKVVPPEFYAERDELQEGWIKLAETADIAELAAKCAAEEKAFYGKWSAYDFADAKASSGYLNRWAKKTEIFIKESAE